jgi:hypothetical protein
MIALQSDVRVYLFCKGESDGDHLDGPETGQD